METSYQWFMTKVREITGLDLASYKETQMVRRLGSFMNKHQKADYSQMVKSLQADPTFLRLFMDFVTINVSEFYRNPEHFGALEKQVLPGLLSGRPKVRIWSAGCSDGSEPYTVAMILSELGVRNRYEIWATDIDEQILARAQTGLYRRDQIRSVRPELIDKYFTEVDGKIQVQADLRRKITFQRHNLLADSYGQDWDLIICRNVVIYFTDEAKKRIYRGFHQALRPGGILFVGGTESIFNARELGFRSVLPFFYQKEECHAQSTAQ